MPTHSFIVRALAVASALAIASPLACGGKSTGGGPGGGSSGSGGATGSGSGGMGGDTGSSGAGGTTGAMGGASGSGVGGAGGSGGSSGTGVGGSGGTSGIIISDGGPPCVDIKPSDFDTSCNTVADCTVVPVGMLCTGGCECTGGTISKKALPKYNAAVASIVPAACGCAYAGVAECQMGQCVFCSDPYGAGCGDGGTTTIDAGAPTEGGIIGIDGGSGGGGGSLNCDTSPGGVEYCYSYSGLTPAAESAEASACTSGGGKVVASCPTTGLSGCCEGIVAAPITYGYCIYGVSGSTIPALQSACASEKGTWSK